MDAPAAPRHTTLRQQTFPHFGLLLAAALEVGAHRLLRTVGVAIDTEVRAAVIGADVLARDAAAGRALARILGGVGGWLHAGQQGELPAGRQLRLYQCILRAKAADEGVVDTFVFMDAQGAQVDAFGEVASSSRCGQPAFRDAMPRASSRISSTVGAR